MWGPQGGRAGGRGKECRGCPQLLQGGLSQGSSPAPAGKGSRFYELPALLPPPPGACWAPWGPHAGARGQPQPAQASASRCGSRLGREQHLGTRPSCAPKTRVAGPAQAQALSWCPLSRPLWHTHRVLFLLEAAPGTAPGTEGRGRSPVCHSGRGVVAKSSPMVLSRGSRPLGFTIR